MLQLRPGPGPILPSRDVLIAHYGAGSHVHLLDLAPRNKQYSWDASEAPPLRNDGCLLPLFSLGRVWDRNGWKLWTSNISADSHLGIAVREAVPVHERQSYGLRVDDLQKCPDYVGKMSNTLVSRLSFLSAFASLATRVSFCTGSPFLYSIHFWNGGWCVSYRVDSFLVRAYPAAGPARRFCRRIP
jgi:hypothetical protein